MKGTVTFAGLTGPAVDAITTVLQRRGYRVIRSFDLQSALSHQVDQCPCPHHGTDQCTCQYVVLLAYPPATNGGRAPHVLTAHGEGGTTRVALQHDGSTDVDVQFALVSALVEAALLLSPGEPIVENRTPSSPTTNG
jgi:hypothetical protein